MRDGICTNAVDILITQYSFTQPASFRAPQGVIEILESGEVNPNTEDLMGFSPLMRAAQQNKTK